MFLGGKKWRLADESDIGALVWVTDRLDGSYQLDMLIGIDQERALTIYKTNNSVYVYALVDITDAPSLTLDNISTDALANEMVKRGVQEFYGKDMPRDYRWRRGNGFIDAKLEQPERSVTVFIVTEGGYWRTGFYKNEIWYCHVDPVRDTGYVRAPVQFWRYIND